MFTKKFQKNDEVHAYLAGPDVFYPGAAACGEAKKKAVEAIGVIGHFPFDNQIDFSKYADPRDAAYEIGHQNEEMMMNCLKDGKIAVIYANMRPWHGSPSMDTGTAFEVGFYSAMAKLYPGRVLIMGYYENKQDFEETLSQRYARMGATITEKDGMLTDQNGYGLEPFGLRENLMIEQACKKTGGAVCASFEEAVAQSKSLIEQLKFVKGGRAPNARSL